MTDICDRDRRAVPATKGAPSWFDRLTMRAQGGRSAGRGPHPELVEGRGPAAASAPALSFGIGTPDILSLLVALVVGLLVVLATRPAWAAEPTTLEKVRARGHLICATVDPLPGFAEQDDEGLWSGFDVDFCRAVAAAVFGDPTKFEFVPLAGSARFAPLQTGIVDLVARDASWTARRDSSYGVIFAGASFFDGQAIMVPQSMNAVSAYQLDKVSICALDGGEDLTNLRDFFFQNQAAYTEVLYEDRRDLSEAYRAGLCDAVSASASWLNALRRSLPEPAAQRILPERLSKDMFGPVVRKGDDQWLSIVQWTLYTLIDAEEAGVTSLNVDSLEAARTHSVRRLLGLESRFGAALGLGPDFMRNIIKAVGNYGEVYDRNFGPETGAPVARGQNALWTRGGLLFAPPIE